MLHTVVDKMSVNHDTDLWSIQPMAHKQ